MLFVPGVDGATTGVEVEGPAILILTLIGPFELVTFDDGTDGCVLLEGIGALIVGASMVILLLRGEEELGCHVDELLYAVVGKPLVSIDGSCQLGRLLVGATDGVTVVEEPGSLTRGTVDTGAGAVATISELIRRPTLDSLSAFKFIGSTVLPSSS
jgi:hypothetical protein